MTKKEIMAHLSMAHEHLEDIYYSNEIEYQNLSDLLDVLSIIYTNLYETLPLKEKLVSKKKVVLDNAITSEEILKTKQIRIDSMISWGYEIELKDGDTRCMTINEACYDWRKDILKKEKI